MVVREYGRYQDFDSRHKNRVKTPTSSVGLSLFDMDVACHAGPSTYAKLVQLTCRYSTTDIHKLPPPKVFPPGRDKAVRTSSGNLWFA